MPSFRAPMIYLYSRDLSRAAAFYSELGFVETFRTPASGEPVHIELTLDGFTLGIATIEAAREHHGLRPVGESRWIKIVLLLNYGIAQKRTRTIHVFGGHLFEKEIILEEQLAAQCLFQCSPARKLPAKAGTLDY
jgi:hypothetical protein